MLASPSRLYRQYFTPAEIRRLDEAPHDSALSDIQLLRVLFTRVLAAAQRKRSLTLLHRLDMLAAFCHAAITMASLVRFEHKHMYPDGPPDPLLEEMAAFDDEPL